MLGSFERFEQSEQAGGFSNARELDAEGLDLHKQVLHVDDFVSYEGLMVRVMGDGWWVVGGG